MPNFDRSDVVSRSFALQLSETESKGVNKTFLANTIRDVDSHNRKEVMRSTAMLLVSSKLAFFLCSKKIPAGERIGCKSNGNSMTRIARRTPRHSCPQRVMQPLNESFGLFGRYYLLEARISPI